MRISGLFQRTQVQSVAVVGNDGEDALIDSTERKNLERRQSNASNTEASALPAGTKATPSPIEGATKAAPTQPANLPGSIPDPTTFATSIVKPDPSPPLDPLAKPSTTPEAQSPPAATPPTQELATYQPTQATIPTTTSINTPTLDPAAVASTTPIIGAPNLPPPVTATSVPSSPAGIAALAAPATPAANPATATSNVDSNPASKTTGASSVSGALASNSASTQIPGLAAGAKATSDSVSATQTGSTPATGSDAAAKTGISSGSASVTGSPGSASASDASASLADLLASGSALSQTLIPVSALTGSLTDAGPSSATGIFAEAQSAAAGTGVDGGILSSGVKGKGPGATGGTGGANTISATATILKKPQNIAGIVVGSVVGAVALGFGILFFMRRFYRTRREGKRADTPPQSPLLTSLNSPLLPIGIARSMSQRSGGEGSFWSAQGGHGAGASEKEYGYGPYGRGVSTAPLSPLPELPRAEDGGGGGDGNGGSGVGGKKQGWSGSGASGNAGFTLFPPVPKGKNAKDFPRDF